MHLHEPEPKEKRRQKPKKVQKRTLKQEQPTLSAPNGKARALARRSQPAHAQGGSRSLRSRRQRGGPSRAGSGEASCFTWSVEKPRQTWRSASFDARGFRLAWRPNAHGLS